VLAVTVSLASGPKNYSIGRRGDGIKTKRRKREGAERRKE
jgi:hypothetical protein